MNCHEETSLTSPFLPFFLSKHHLSWNGPVLRASDEADLPLLTTGHDNSKTGPKGPRNGQDAPRWGTVIGQGRAHGGPASSWHFLARGICKISPAAAAAWLIKQESAGSRELPHAPQKEETEPEVLSEPLSPVTPEAIPAQGTLLPRHNRVPFLDLVTVT